MLWAMERWSEATGGCWKHQMFPFSTCLYSPVYGVCLPLRLSWCLVPIVSVSPLDNVSLSVPQDSAGAALWASSQIPSSVVAFRSSYILFEVFPDFSSSISVAGLASNSAHCSSDLGVTPKRLSLTLWAWCSPATCWSPTEVGGGGKSSPQLNSLSSVVARFTASPL